MIVALLLASPVLARLPPWHLGPCTLSRTYDDGTALSVRRQAQGAVVTVTKSGWLLPKSQTINLFLFFGGRGFGHPRDVAAIKTPSKTGLTFLIDDDLVLAFKVMNGVKIMRGAADLTNWLELDGSSRAYAKLSRCPAP